MPKRSVLVVSDQGPLPASLEAQLSNLDFELQGVAPSEEEALARARASPPDLVLIDAAPGGGGSAVSFAESLEREGRFPVLLVVEAGDAERLGLSTEGEPLAYVVKPCTEGELRASLALALFRCSADRTVRALEDRFFHNSIDLLCMLDFNGHFKRLNPAWERTLGFTRQELMSKPFIEFVHPDDRERTLEQNREVRGGGQALDFENRYLCRDGSFRWLRWNAAPDSDVRIIYSVARDITAQREAEAERERLLAQLQTALAEVRTLGELLPICSYCRKIRDDEAYWHTVEGYVARHTDTRFTHSICPDCMATEVEPKLTEFERD